VSGGGGGGCLGQGQRVLCFPCTPQDRISTKYSTPLLVLSNGEKVHDSRAILEFANGVGDPGRTIFPPAHRGEVSALLATFHDKLGPDTRRIGYYFLLGGSDDVVRKVFANNVGSVQGALATAALPFLKSQLSKGLGVNRDRMLKSLTRVEEQVRRVCAPIACPPPPPLITATHHHRPAPAAATEAVGRPWVRTHPHVNLAPPRTPAS
jgi:hypothetical protein